MRAGAPLVTDAVSAYTERMGVRMSLNSHCESQQPFVFES